LDRFVDLCCHYDNDPLFPSGQVFYHEDHGLANLGLIDIVEYNPIVTLRITSIGVEVFADLKKYDPISLINSCIHLRAWGTASYFVWTLSSKSQLPEFLTHENKEIREAAANRLSL